MRLDVDAANQNIDTNFNEHRKYDTFWLRITSMHSVILLLLITQKNVVFFWRLSGSSFCIKNNRFPIVYTNVLTIIIKPFQKVAIRNECFEFWIWK